MSQGKGRPTGKCFLVLATALDNDIQFCMIGEICRVRLRAEYPEIEGGRLYSLCPIPPEAKNGPNYIHIFFSNSTCGLYAYESLRMSHLMYIREPWNKKEKIFDPVCREVLPDYAWKKVVKTHVGLGEQQ